MQLVSKQFNECLSKVSQRMPLSDMQVQSLLHCRLAQFLCNQRWQVRISGHEVARKNDDSEALRAHCQRRLDIANFVCGFKWFSVQGKYFRNQLLNQLTSEEVDDSFIQQISPVHV